MTVPTSFPILAKPETTKDRIFIILSGKYPLSLIELQNMIKTQFNISVSFQSVRKATLQLVNDGVLIKEGKKFSFNKEWILGLIKYGSLLQKQYLTATKDKSKIEIGDYVTVYTLHSLVDLDYIWNELIKKSISESDAPKIITFKTTHFWFLIATLAQETELIKEMLKKNIKLYYLCYGNTALDKWTVQMYKQIGIYCKILPKPKEFTKGLNIGTYEDYIIQTTHPEKITNKIETFFSKYKEIKDLPLTDISEIVTAKEEIKLQVQKDPILAESMRKEIMKHFS